MNNTSSLSLKKTLKQCVLFLFISLSLFEKAYAVYCVPSNPACNASSYINSVSIVGTTFNNATMACNSLNGTAYSIFTPSSTTTATLQPGNTYQVSVNCFGASIISLWIDYDQNQVFDASEWTQVATASVSNVVSTVSIVVPLTAITGATGIRVRSRISTSLNGPTDACTAFGSGEAEDYSVTIGSTAPCVAPPVAGTTVSTATQVCSNVPFTLSLSGASTGSGLTYQWQTSANNSTWNALSGANSSTLLHTITAASFLRCALTCSGQISYSTSIYVALNTPTQCYCSSAPIYNTLSDIGQVSIGSMSNGSAGIVTSNTSAINSYTDFTGGSIFVTSLDRGATYPMIVQQITSGTQANIATAVVYIDYNQNGLFEYPAEFTWLGTTTIANGGNVLVNSVNIPATASLGFTRMRVILSEGTNPTQQACGTYFFGETEDYLVNIVAPQNCSGTFVAGTTVSSSTSVCGNVPFSLYTIGSTSNSAVSFQWQYSLNNFNWSNVAVGGTQAIYSTTQSQSTYYRCALTCNGLTLYSTTTYVNHTPLQNCYCNSAPTNANYTDIGNVSIGSLSNGLAQPVFNNTTAIATYSNFTSLSPTALNIGAQYPITVSQILSSATFYSAFGIVFIDYNQDGSFSSTEALFLGTTANTSGGTQLSGIVTIPTNALPGVTRMRVMLVENGNGLQSACGNYGFGETEDYLVDLTVGQPCVFPPTAGIAISNISQVCTNTLFTLNLSGNSTGSGQTYTWQSSINNSTWTNISTGNNYPNLSFTQTQSTYYRCLVNCGGFIDYSSSIFILQNSVSACYCASFASNAGDTDIGNVTLNTLTNGTATPIFSNPTANRTFTDYTALPATDLQRGGNYLLSISQITSGVSFFNSSGVAYIDFNQDGVFGFGESFTIGGTLASASLYTISNYITVPSTATLGNTRMRIILSEGSAAASCATYNYGETEDYTVNIVVAQSCPSPFLGGNAVANTSSVCPGIPVNLSLSGNSATPIATYSWQYSYDNINYFSLTGGSNAAATAYQTQSTYYRCSITCSGNTVLSNPIWVATTIPTQCYCASAATFATLADIGNVSIGTLNNGIASPSINNSNSINTYTNFTSLPAPSLELGTLAFISVSQINQTTFTASNIAVYFDFNQNGVFDIATEAFSLGQTSSVIGGSTKSTYIAIPAGAVLGQTRMRVVLQTGVGTGFLPCGAYNNGETEDYTVNIIPTQPCLSAPIAGNAVASDTTICAGSLVNLSLINNSTFASQSYQWQQSPDNINWTSIGGAIYPTLVTTFLTPMYYRCIVTCNIFIVYSSSVHVIANPANQCYCTSSATNTDDDDIGNVTFLALNNGIATPATNNPTAVNLYSDFTSLPPQAVILGATYPISVTQINQANYFTAKINVYIDFNQNGIFEAGAETIVLGTTTSAVGGNTLTANITIPFTALSGLTRMRIVLVEGAGVTVSPCGTYTWGETEDYSLIILQNQSCTNPPTSGNANSSAGLVCQNAPFTLYLSGNSSALGQYFQWQASPDAITWNNLGSISLDSSFIYSQTSATYYRCAVTCSGLTSYSVPVFVDMLQSPICGYCTNIGGTSCPSNTKITNVTLAGTTLNNSDTTCYSINGSAVGVFPFGGSTTATIIRGNTYTISVTSSQNVSKSVWIDYDQNGSFSSNEWTSICTTSTAGVADVATINIPWGIPGGPTGLRVRTRISGPANGAPDACSFFGSGETEDYTVLVDIGNSILGTEANQKMFIYPNPAKNWAMLKLSGTNFIAGTIYVANTLGEIVFQKAIHSSETIIEMESLPVGIYIVKCELEGKSLYGKLIKE